MDASKVEVPILTPLSASERASAQRMQLASYPEGASVGWDNAAFFSTTEPYALLRDTFAVRLTAGATYNFFSSSYFDPFILIVYDANGSAVAWDTNLYSVDYGADVVWDFRAGYTGDYYVSASWDQGTYDKFVWLAVYEDVNTTPPPSVVYGTFGNDVLHNSSISQRFEGGAGYDVFETSGAGRRSVTLQAQASGEILAQHGGQLDTLAGVEEVRFADGRLVFDPSHAAAQIVRLYQAALGRAPDQAGLNAWIEALEVGAPLQALAQGFLGSAEFASRMGADLSDSAVVTRLYQNVLGRAPDQDGHGFWTGALQQGTTRAQVLAGFSESVENKAITAPTIASGIWDVSETAAQVARLYDTVFGRLPDVGGLVGWRSAIETGGSNLQAVAGSFVASAEFQARYGALGDAGFVSALYRNTLHREPDAEGLSAWTGTLARGAARADVVLGFSESAEHKANTTPNVMNENPGQFGILFA